MTDNKARDELNQLRYNICLNLGYDDGIKGTQHRVIAEDNLEEVMRLIDAYAESRVAEANTEVRLNEHEMLNRAIRLRLRIKEWSLHRQEELKELTDNQERRK